MKRESKTLKAHRVVLYLTTIGLAVYGVLAIFNPEILAGGFNRFTGLDWQVFQTDNKSLAAYISFLWRLIGAFNLVAGLTLTLIIWKWLQLGRGWAWITLLVGTCIAYLSPMSMDLTVKSIEFFEVIEFLLFGLFIITMLVVRREYSPRLRSPG